MDAYRAQLQSFDQDIADAIRGEERRQSDGVEMIPSENYTYPEVLAALGSVLTNKYSEGYPGRRYYGGQEYTDVIENIARDRACALFRAEHANVQPLSGSPMNQACYFAFLNPGDTVLAMDLSHGGHLTHGAPVSHMGKVFNFMRNPFDSCFDVVTTTTHKTLRGSRGGLILSKAAYAKKIDSAVFPGLQGGPHMNNIAGAAITFKKAAASEFIEYAQATLRNAKALAAALLAEGVTLVTGGTDNHLLVIDTVASFDVDGQVAEEALDS